MAGRNREGREAAGTAGYRRSLSRFGCALSAWLAGPLLVFGAISELSSVSLHAALAGQHAPAQPMSAPHSSVPHASASHSFGQNYSAPHTPAQRPSQQFRSVAPASGKRGISTGVHVPSSGTQSFGNEQSSPAQPTRSMAPLPQNASPNRGYPAPRSPQGYVENGNSQAGGEHLGSWMRQHQNQSPNEQEQALHREPGFSRLAPSQQQNLVNRLHQLNQMPPQQRARTMERVENLERLSPERRQAVRSSAQQLSELPQDRKRMVQKAFRDLREMPPDQRRAVINSPQFGGQYSAQERSIMGNLLAVEPYQHAGSNPTHP